MRSILLVVVVAACEHGSGGVELTELEVPTFIPMRCTGGMPGATPSCPINTVTLDSIGVDGGTLSFVARAPGGTMELEDVTLAASDLTFRAVHPTFSIVGPDDRPRLPDDPFADLSVELRAGDRVALAGVVELGVAEPSDRMIIRFDELLLFLH